MKTEYEREGRLRYTSWRLGMRKKEGRGMLHEDWI